jgi:hypothetical protein
MLFQLALIVLFFSKKFHEQSRFNLAQILFIFSYYITTMSAFKMHSVIPENAKNNYTEYNLLDFVCSFPSRKMLANTCRLSFDVRVLQNNAVLTDEDIKFSSAVGGHNFIEGITTQLQMAGQIESIHTYPRQVSMTAGATKDLNDYNNAMMSAELRASDDIYSAIQLRGESVKNLVDDTTLNLDNSVSIKPMFCLNRVFSADSSGDVGVSYAKSGNVRVTFQLARVYDALYGSGVDSNTSYVIRNPRFEFLSVADDGVKNALTLRVSHSIKQLVNSSLSNLGLKAPVIADAASVSFIQQNRQSQPQYDDTACEQLPNVSRLDFNWNNTTNQGVTYTIRDNVEIIARYLDSLKTAGANSASLPVLSANKSYGVGLSFGEPIDLSKTTLNVAITSEVNTASAYTAIFYFSGIIQF